MLNHEELAIKLKEKHASSVLQLETACRAACTALDTTLAKVGEMHNLQFHTLSLTLTTEIDQLRLLEAEQNAVKQKLSVFLLKIEDACQLLTNK